MAAARIYKPARTAMQQGLAAARDWVLEFEPQAARTIEPLMGWTSSADTRRPGAAHLRDQGGGHSFRHASWHCLPPGRAARGEGQTEILRGEF